MLASLLLNKVLFGAILAACIFSGLVAWVDPVNLIVFLNGVLIGAMVAIATTYFKIIMLSLAGIGEYTRVRHMAISFFLLWTIIAFSTMSSIYARFSNNPVFTPTVVAAIRYLGIIAAVMQVTAPDFGYALTYGRDRKLLWIGVGLGIITAIGIIVFQKYTDLN